jgi:hypothetical protein
MLLLFWFSVVELLEDRREWDGRLCKPALIVAVAASETDDARDVGEGLMLSRDRSESGIVASSPALPEILLALVALTFVREDSGSELRSGSILVNTSLYIRR